jgi:hypothetical protein
MTKEKRSSMPFCSRGFGENVEKKDEFGGLGAFMQVKHTINIKKKDTLV